jgi:7-carboxy-7-deazaguanine synthase
MDVLHTLIINEIFHSIQGESSHAGRRCVFIRLTYCNLRCSYCDTAYAFEEGTEMSLLEILSTVRQFDCKLIEITGGEPLLQPAVYKLMDALCDQGYEVLLETGGSIDVSRVRPEIRKILDFKCPSSGMEKKNMWENVHYLRAADEIKFVIGSREDYEWAKQKIVLHSLTAQCPVLMSVVFDQLRAIELAEWILADKLDVRYQLQMQKIIWKPEARGV